MKDNNEEELQKIDAIEEFINLLSLIAKIFLIKGDSLKERTDEYE